MVSEKVRFKNLISKTMDDDNDVRHNNSNNNYMKWITEGRRTANEGFDREMTAEKKNPNA